MSDYKTSVLRSKFNDIFENSHSVWDIVTTYHSQLSPSIICRMVSEAMPNSRHEEEHCVTNCVSTMITLSFLFHYNCSHELMKPFTDEHTSIYTASTNNGQTVIKICDFVHRSATSLFSNQKLNDVKQSERNLEEGKKHIQNLVSDHFEGILHGESINALALVQEYSDNFFDFNRLVFEKLKCDIDSNKKLLSDTNEFIYYLALVRPAGKRKGFVHAFTVHQFLDEKSLPRFQIYQSLVKNFTLKEYINSRKTEKPGLNESEFRLYLENLEVIVCDNSKIITSIQLKDAYVHCFSGIPLKHVTMQEIYQSGDNEVTISGTSFCYQTSNFDKTKLLENIYSYLNKQSLLEVFVNPMKEQK